MVRIARLDDDFWGIFQLEASPVEGLFISCLICNEVNFTVQINVVVVVVVVSVVNHYSKKIRKREK